jgi:transmembrane sensor
MTTRREQAARWFAAVRRGVMTVDDRSAFDAWRSERKNADALSEMEATWALLESLAPAATRNVAASVRRSHPARAMMFAVACVASLGIGVMSYGGDSQFWTTLDWSNR